ncbi:MAG: ribonuclease P protein subunit [Promethearchaeota archaeon]
MKNMRNNPEWFIYLDMIGVDLDAKHKTNPTWTTFKPIGKCVDETKYTLIMEQHQHTKIFIKKEYIFRVWLPQDDSSSIQLEFDGSKIVGRPEQRIKLIRKKLHKKYH